MLWHMLLFGDAFGPAYICYFLVFLHPIMLFWGGVKLQKMLSTGNYATLWSFPAFTAVLVVFNACVYSRMYYVCVYAKYTLCVHTAVRPRNMPRNINRMIIDWMLFGCDQLIINTKYFFEIQSIIFPENTEQDVMLCCRCQHVKFSRLYNPEGNGRTANPLHVSAGNMRKTHRELKPHTALPQHNSSTRKSGPDIYCTSNELSPNPSCSHTNWDSNSYNAQHVESG